MIHQWIVEMLMCTCNWLNMKQTILLPSSWFLPWPPQSQRNCRMQDCGSLSLQTQTSCCLSPQCFQRTSAPEEKNQHPPYWRRAKAINVNSLRNCKPTFIAMTLFHIKRKTALQRLFSLSKNICNTEVLANLANISCT